MEPINLNVSGLEDEELLEDDEMETMDAGSGMDISLNIDSANDIHNCYDNLGVRYGESEVNLKKKFIELSKIHHPDKGGDKAFFDVICQSYRKIKRLRRSSEFPVENAEYVIGEDLENDTVMTQQEFLVKVKSVKSAFTPGYNEYATRTVNKSVEKDNLGGEVYNPNYFNGRSKDSDGVKMTPQTKESINYTGRVVDSTQYFGIVEYGKFGSVGSNKGAVEGYDLGNSFSGVSMEPPKDNCPLDSVSQMRKFQNDRDALDNELHLNNLEIIKENKRIQEIKIENRINELVVPKKTGWGDEYIASSKKRAFCKNPRDEFFDKRNEDHTLECDIEYQTNKIATVRFLGY
jgi:hypothetical protein